MHEIVSLQEGIDCLEMIKIREIQEQSYFSAFNTLENNKSDNTINFDQEVWILDSGPSAHMTGPS